eukprot:gene9824-11638_t
MASKVKAEPLAEIEHKAQSSPVQAIPSCSELLSPTTPATERTSPLQKALAVSVVSAASDNEASGDDQSETMAPPSPPVSAPRQAKPRPVPLFDRGNLVSILRGVTSATLCRLLKSNSNLSLAIVKDCRWDNSKGVFTYRLAFSAASGGPADSAFLGTEEEEFEEAQLEPCRFAPHSAAQVEGRPCIVAGCSTKSSGCVVKVHFADVAADKATSPETRWFAYKQVERCVPGKGALLGCERRATRQEVELLTRGVRQEDFNETADDARFNEALLVKSAIGSTGDDRLARGPSTHEHVGSVRCVFEFTELTPVTGEELAVRPDLRVMLQDITCGTEQPLQCLVSTEQLGTGEVFATDGSAVLTNAHVVHTSTVTKQELVQICARLMKQDKQSEGVAVWELLKHLDTVEDWAQYCVVSERAEASGRNECFPTAVTFTLTHSKEKLRGLVETVEVPTEYLQRNIADTKHICDVALFTLQRPLHRYAYPVIPKLRIAAARDPACAGGFLVDVSGLGGTHMEEVRGELGVAHKGNNFANSIKHSGSTLHGGSGSMLLLSSRQGDLECEGGFKYAYALHYAMGSHLKDGAKQASPVYNQAIMLGSSPVLDWLHSTLGARCPPVEHFGEQDGVDRRLMHCRIPVGQEQAIWAAFLLDSMRFSKLESVHSTSEEDVLRFLMEEFSPFRSKATQRC